MTIRREGKTDGTLLGLVAALATLALTGCGGETPGTSNQKTAQKCGIDSDCDQVPGQICVNQICTTPFQGGDVVGSDGSGSLDGAASDGAVGDGSVDDSGTSGDAANDTGGTVGTGGSCKQCANDSECGADHGCVPLLNSPPSFCVKKCVSNDDCAGGLVCDQPTSAPQKFCIPPTYKCEGCATTGCKAGESCDFIANPPTCSQVGGACSKCLIPKDCGEGLTCVKIGKEKVCAPTCGGGSTCPANSSCATFAAGITACAFGAAACSYSDPPAAACAGCPGKCVAGQCVECLNDSQCASGSACIAGTFTCAKDKCPADKPQKLVTGQCVECTNDTHCAASSVGPKCIGNACAPATQTNECAVCKDPYPGCVEINGTWSCVECATDDDCKAKNKGTCSSKTYTCSATTSGTGPTSGSCKSDADCPAGTTGFDLACDVPTGLCYDKNGQCDNLAAFCNAAAGSVCKPFDALGLGGAGGGLPQIPGLPGSGGGGAPATPGAGVCSCGASSGGGGTSTMKQECALLAGLDPKLKLCDCAKDPNDANCKNALLGDCCASGGGGGGSPLDLLGCLSALQGGKADAKCFGGATCLDLSCLTAMMGGGGGSGSQGGGGYCSAAGGP